jgi:integrase
MTPRKRESRIYWRMQGGVRRAYLDARDYAAEGGKMEALRAVGEHWATSDPDVAQKLASERIAQLEARRRGHALLGTAKETTLGAMAALHLDAKAESGRYTPEWLAVTEGYLRRALAVIGAERDPQMITVEDVRRLVTTLRTTPNRRGGTLGDGTVRHHLSALSGVFRRAQSEGYVLPGFNPVASMLDKPRAPDREARWLEMHEGALYLEAARTYPAPVDGTPYAYPLIATFLLTGAREREVYGLELDDVSFERGRITFRENKWRRLKTRGSARVVRLWPQLEAILKDYLKGPHRPVGELLFPSMATGQEAMLEDTRKLLDHVAIRAGFLEVVYDADGRPTKRRGMPVYKGTPIRTKIFRHTYCATRLQTLDQGAPVSNYTVSRELGHSSLAMVERTYAHLGEVRHRAEVVEYRPEHFAEQLRSQLAKLGVLLL